MAVPFGGPHNNILYLDPKISKKTAILGSNFDWTVFAAENCFNMGIQNIKYP